jgi:hypothetical protein
MKLQPSLEHGRVRERLMRPVLKTEMGSEPARVGSNPTSSAMIADVAQQAERSPCKGRVAGSNPCHRLQRFMAWPRGEAAGCNPAHTGSNPVAMSKCGTTSARGAQQPSKLMIAEFDSPGPLHFRRRWRR